MQKSRRTLLGLGLLMVVVIAGMVVYPWLWRANTERMVESGNAAVELPGAGVGLPNLHRVGPTLYRGAQPEEAGFAELEKMGVKTVINLRSFHSDQAMMGETGLAYYNIDMKAWRPKDEDVARFLRLATDPANQPVFVHCQHGADRTGVCCAAYRLVVEGWTKERAIAEMTEGGFGFHAVWKDLVEYVREMDVEAMREKAGLKDSR